MTEQQLSYEVITDHDTELAGESPLRMARRALRGRLRIAFVLAMILAPLFAAIGYFALPPKYESTGIVRIDGALPAILYPTYENQVPPMFDAFLATQVALVRSRPLLEAAIASPAMRQAGWPAGVEGVTKLNSHLNVYRRRGERIIIVSVADRRPHRAEAAVNAILAAYSERFSGPESLTISEKEAPLSEREKKLERTLRDLRVEMLDLSEQYGRDGIDDMHAQRVEELLVLNRKISDLEIAAARAEAGLEPIAPTTTFGDGASLSPLQEREVALQAELQMLRKRYAEGHPAVRRLSAELETVQIHRELRQRTIRSDVDVRAGADETGAPNLVARRLRDLEENYRVLRKTVQSETSELGRTRVQLAALTERERQAMEQLDTTRRRLDEIRFETSNQKHNRVNIIAGDLPVAPLVDKRHGMAGVGLAGGVLTGIGIALLAGLLDRRVRYVDDLAALELPSSIINLIPELDGNDPDSRARVQRSIDKLRNLLDLKPTHAAQPTYAITSCGRGEGKTSLALGLGSAFACAGQRTVVIDFDFATATLSRELGSASQFGLCEVLGAPQRLDEALHETARPDLWVLPLGRRVSLSTKHLTRRRFEPLIDRLRERFDVILIDAGSILTDIEASLAAISADQTIFLVGRFQRRDLIRVAFERLTQLEVSCVGTVMHRVESADYARLELSPSATAIGTIGPSGLEPSGPDLAIVGSTEESAAGDEQQKRPRAA